MGLEVQVLPRPVRRERREAQGADREGGAEGSVERTCEPTYRNRIRGAANQGELAKDSEALAVKDSRVDPAAVQGKSMVLPGEISPYF